MSGYPSPFPALMDAFKGMLASEKKLQEPCHRRRDNLVVRIFQFFSFSSRAFPKDESGNGGGLRLRRPQPPNPGRRKSASKLSPARDAPRHRTTSIKRESVHQFLASRF